MSQEDSSLELEGKALGIEGRAKFYRVMDLIYVLTFALVSLQSWVIWQHMNETSMWSRALVAAIREQSCMLRYVQDDRIKHLPECQQESRIP